MYKEKLQSQLELLEELQQKSKKCGEVAEVIELGRQILSIAKGIDRIEKTGEVTINLTIDGKEICNKVRKLNDDFKEKHQFS